MQLRLMKESIAMNRSIIIVRTWAGITQVWIFIKSDAICIIDGVEQNIATCFRHVLVSGSGGDVGGKRVEWWRRNGKVVCGELRYFWDSALVSCMYAERPSGKGPLVLKQPR
jgi:hypothetical protein